MLIAVLFVASCSGPARIDGADELIASRSEARSEVRVELSLYVVASNVDGSPLGSARTEDEIAGIGELINEVWAPSGIRFAPINVATVVVPDRILEALARGDNAPFLSGAGVEFEVPGPAVLNGFYVAEAGGANGFTPGGTRVFFVDDQPTVHDERVSSHELGHLFGLRHDLTDSDQLMFSGTNGTGISDIEIEVARYGAEGLLENG